MFASLWVTPSRAESARLSYVTSRFQLFGAWRSNAGSSVRPGTLAFDVVHGARLVGIAHLAADLKHAKARSDAVGSCHRHFALDIALGGRISPSRLPVRERVGARCVDIDTVQHRKTRAVRVARIDAKGHAVRSIEVRRGEIALLTGPRDR